MTKRGPIILISAAVFVVMAVALEIHMSVSRPVAKVGRPAPAFAAQTSTGQTFALHQVQQEPVMLDFFATWCGPCQQEMPTLNKFAAKTSGNVKIIMIDRGDSRLMIQQFIKKYHVSKNITVLFNQPDKLSSLYQITGQPEAIFINRQGIVVKHTEGPLTEAQMMRYTAGK